MSQSKKADFLPSSTVTFPLKKNFPWPLERATPRLKQTNKTNKNKQKPLKQNKQNIFPKNLLSFTD